MANLWDRIDALKASSMDDSRTQQERDSFASKADELEARATAQGIPRDNSEYDEEDESYEWSAQEVWAHHYAVLDAIEKHDKWQKLKDFLFHVFVLVPSLLYLYLATVHGNEAALKPFELVFNELRPIWQPIWSMSPEASQLPFYPTLSRLLGMAAVAGVHWMVLLAWVIWHAFRSPKVDWWTTLSLGGMASIFLLLRTLIFFETGR